MPHLHSNSITFTSQMYTFYNAKGIQLGRNCIGVGNSFFDVNKFQYNEKNQAILAFTEKKG